MDKKGLDVAIRAFAKIHERYRKAEFTIAGEGALQPQLEALATELGVARRCAFSRFPQPSRTAAMR